MRIDKDKQRAAQEKAQQLLVLEEQKRAEQRLLKLIQDLEQGSEAVLFSNEFLENLPGIISTLCQKENHEQVKGLLENLGELACSKEQKLHERAVMTLSLCLSELSSDVHPDIRDLIGALLLRWLEAETEYFSVCAIVCRQLQEAGIMKMEEGLWKECNPILELFNSIQSGELNKSNAIRGVVGRALEAMAADHILEELTPVSLRGRGERRANAEKTLDLLGRKAAAHLMDTLISSREKEDRLRLIEIIPAMGYAAAAVLKEYLQKDLPWYGVRNIVAMIATMEARELLPLTLPFLEHEDIRVQQQVVDCIHAVEKDHPGEQLLFALAKVDDTLKVSLIESLGRSREPGAMEAFLDLLGHRESFSANVRVRDDILKSLAVQVRLSDSIRAVNLLTMLLEEREAEYDPETDAVSQAISQSLQILEPRLGSAKTSEPGAEAPPAAGDDKFEGEPTFNSDPLSKGKAKRNVQKINEEVALLLGESKVTDASQLLYEKCIEAAMNKDFATAEMLRDRILEVDPNALPQLIRAGERIEEERSSAIPQNHITVWQDLYDSLSTEEFNALYQVLKLKNYSNGSVVVEQGTSSPALFFINSGQARLTCGDSEEEIFLKKVQPGEIVGVGPFFDVSVWTVSLTAVEKTDVHVLQRKDFLELSDKYPNIDTCLRNFCLKNATVRELLEMSGKDRRRAARYPMSMVVKHTLLDPFGEEETRSFNGEIADISTGGCSFHIQISSRENARLLLGRHLQTQFTAKEDNPVVCDGQIVAVRHLKSDKNKHSVHVQFNESITDSVVKSIVNTK